MPAVEEPFRQAWEDVAPALHAWARLRVRPALRRRVDPDDLVQETCAEAWSSYARFDAERGSFRAWTFTIATRVLTQALRRLGREGVPLEHGSGASSLLARIPESITSISQRAARDEEVARFCARVETLPEDEQRLLVHHGLEGRTLGEVAELLGLEREATKKRWQRLVARLRAEGAPAGLGWESGESA